MHSLHQYENINRSSGMLHKANGGKNMHREKNFVEIPERFNFNRHDDPAGTYEKGKEVDMTR